MLNSITLGIIGALAVALPFRLGLLLEGKWNGLHLGAPILILGVTGFAMLAQRFLYEKKTASRLYDGIADLFIHIHQVSSPDSSFRWFLRGFVSLLLSMLGGTVGPEGGAAELSHAWALRLRSRVSRRTERRRVDAASALAAGVSAAFGAPFAAILIAVELGIGGPIVPVVTASLAAFLGMKLLVPDGSYLAIAGFGNLGSVLSSFRLTGMHALSLIAVAVICGIVGAVFTRFVRYTQDTLSDLFKTQLWMKTLTTGVLVFFIFLIYKGGHAQGPQLLERILWGLYSPSEVALLFATQLFALALLIAGFGTIGVFWPVFVLGASVGVIFHGVVGGMSGALGPEGTAGAAALLGAVFGTPLAAGLLVYELTHSVQGLFIALAAGFIGRAIVRFLRTPAFIDHDLESRGLVLMEGRSVAILDAISVSEAMVTDFETFHENDLVTEIYSKIPHARYPFLPIVNSQGQFGGLLAAEMIYEGYDDDKRMRGKPTEISNLLEAKDLLYRSGMKVPTIRANSKLSMSGGMFEDTPCVPVLSEDSKVVGLLFVFGVRLAYDREVARRSMLLNRLETRN